MRTPDDIATTDPDPQMYYTVISRGINYISINAPGTPTKTVDAVRAPATTNNPAITGYGAPLQPDDE